ncbi:hypothetical protein RCCGEPOP_25152 [Rhizobium sp. Pop5]|nr:hypothetical protein RCCGEPOP_25152 [Rhizobium sp. Pop5]
MFFDCWWSVEPSDDCVQARSELLFQFYRQLSFDTTGVAYRRPVDMTIQERGWFPVDNQTDEIGPNILQYPPGCDRRDTQLAEFGYLSLKMA